MMLCGSWGQMWEDQQTLRPGLGDILCDDQQKFQAGQGGMKDQPPLSTSMSGKEMDSDSDSVSTVFRPLAIQPSASPSCPGDLDWRSNSKEQETCECRKRQLKATRLTFQFCYQLAVLFWAGCFLPSKLVSHL